MLALGRSDYFMRHSASVWVQANDATFAMRGRQCDVLVFGDSTAMTGIDPQQIDAATGLHTCNIAVTNAVLAVTNELPLDHFLANNARPGILLVQLSPDDLQRESHVWTQTIYAEGLLEQLRHGSPAETRTLFLTHPRETIAFAGYVAGYTAYHGLRWVWKHLTHKSAAEQRILIRNGFFTPPSPPITACEVPLHHIDPSDRAFPRSFLNDLRDRYRGRAGVVLLDVAPIPVCDENLPAYQKQLAGLTSNTLRGLPITQFADMRHYTAEGARIVSGLIADQVNKARASEAR